MTTVKLVNLTKEYQPGAPAVHDISLTVQQGELMALLGPSGCGKTTTLRLIAGLLEPTRGDLLFDDRSVLKIPAEKRGAVMVFQYHPLFPFMSVGENVAFGLKMQGVGRLEIVERVKKGLSAVQLAGFEARMPDQLSGGQRQRVALARALVVRPKVLLLDEPLSNLEAGLRVDLREMIRILQTEAGITTIFVTHDQAEALAIADRIAFMQAGRLRQIGRPRDFYERPADAQVASFFGGSNFLPGVKQGNLVATPIGSLETSQSNWPEGGVLVTIRPEAFEIGDSGYNDLDAQVRTYKYRGSVSYIEAQVNGVELQVVTPPYRTYKIGERLSLHIPRERVCLLHSRNGA